MQVIIYEVEGKKVILSPSPDCGLTVEEIAAKDVPAGVEYTIMDAEEIQPDIVELRANKWAQIKAERDRLEQSGVPYLGKILDSDTVSVQRIAIAVQAAQAAIAAGQPFTLEWTTQDNTPLTMNAGQVVGMSVALAMYSDSLHQAARALREQIEAAETVEELEVISWPE